MRDAVIERITRAMESDRKTVFLSADFGSPMLDELVRRFPDRFVNVGIAEQNLINVSTGFALEGFTVFAYAIAPFLSMRCFEQVRVNLALMSERKALNVNLLAVGAGYSYDMAGPSHQALEDLCIMRVLPHLEVFSPSDWVSAAAFVPHALSVACPKYIRLDGKALPAIYAGDFVPDVARGFEELARGDGCCIVATGCMTHVALAARDMLGREGIRIGVVDLFMIKSPDETALVERLRLYRLILTLEEGFAGKGGVDMLVSSALHARGCPTRVEGCGIEDRYRFEVASRESHHRQNAISAEALADRVRRFVAVGERS